MFSEVQNNDKGSRIWPCIFRVQELLHSDFIVRFIQQQFPEDAEITALRYDTWSHTRNTQSRDAALGLSKRHYGAYRCGSKLTFQKQKSHPFSRSKNKRNRKLAKAGVILLVSCLAYSSTLKLEAGVRHQLWAVSQLQGVAFRKTRTFHRT
jgi:hypothetical protein